MSSKEEKVWYLKQVDLFQGISDEEIMSIATKVSERKCKKNELLYSPDKKASDTISILKKGEIALYYLHHGKKFIIDVLGPGSIFGNISFGENANTHFAEATQEAYICTFRKEDFIKIIQAKPEIMLRFIQIMSDRLNEYEKKLKNNILDAKEKIQHYFEIREGKREKGIFSKILNKKITHERLAEHTGLSRETVSRAITDLKREGIELPI